jgi:membrane-bound lytic murein transglycosylase D
MTRANNILSNIDLLQQGHAAREQIDLNVPEIELQRKEAQVRQFAEQHWGGRTEEVVQALKRLEELRPALEPILRAEGVPSEWIALVLIESAAQPWAHSRRHARGLWQFIPATARRYGLAVSASRDDRLDGEKATRAAARYLRDLHRRFDDWELALAAYNAGEGAVVQAVARAGNTDFAELSARGFLPEETRRYVPAVLAATELLRPASRQCSERDPDRGRDEARLFIGPAPAGE